MLEELKLLVAKLAIVAANEEQSHQADALAQDIAGIDERERSALERIRETCPVG